MRATSWSAPTSTAEAHARAGGRRHINAVRTFLQLQRQAQVAELLGVHGFGHGARAAIARALGVHRGTVCRDVRAVLRRLREWEARQAVREEVEALRAEALQARRKAEGKR